MSDTLVRLIEAEADDEEDIKESTMGVPILSVAVNVSAKLDSDD